MKQLKIDENNKEIIDHLVNVNKKVRKLTYIELGIFLGILDYDIKDPWSLGEAHDYLGGYKNEPRDMKIMRFLEEGKAYEVNKLVIGVLDKKS